MNNNKTLDIEAFFIEINLKKKKWLLGCSYNPHKTHINQHLNTLSEHLNLYSNRYENMFLIGDFNCEMSEEPMKEFCNNYNLKNLVKTPTCFKNPEKPTLIDLLLTNCPHSFQNTKIIETGLSDFHRMTVTVMKLTFIKEGPNIMSYRNFKHFDNDIVGEKLSRELSKFDHCNLELFKTLFMSIIDTHAPVKKKYIRANNKSFINKELRKAIMHRSKLRNIYLRCE